MNNNEVRNDNRQALKQNGKIKLICLECDRIKSVSPNCVDPRCSCGSVDLDVL